MTDTHVQPDPNARTGCRPPPTPETWALARRRFAAGESAVSVCEALGIAVSSFHKRKADEGWRRNDEQPLIDDFSEWADVDLTLEPHELREVAWRHAARAICNGDRMGARTWLRTVRELEAVQDRDDRIEKARIAELDEEAGVLCDALRREGVEPADVPLLREGREDGEWDYAFQRNIDLHRTLAEARGEEDPYPERPRPGGGETGVPAGAGTAPNLDSSDSSDCFLAPPAPDPDPLPAGPSNRRLSPPRLQHPPEMGGAWRP